MMWNNDEKAVSVKVIAVSGTVEPEVQESVVQNGATDFLGKPYLTRELLIKISHVLHSEGRTEPRVQAGRST
jgi:DNA-binding response OmpR family regulator